MKLVKIILFLVISFIAYSFTLKSVSATEGTIDLVGNNVECLAMSVETYSKNWSILFRCENLLYPPSNDHLFYYAWIKGVENGKIVRLGDIKYGRIMYEANIPFKDVFITMEPKINPTKPSDQVVMRGTVQPYVFPNISSSKPTTITPLAEEQVTDQNQADEIDQQSQTSSSGALAKITSFLLRAGIIVLVVVAIVGIILFVISKLR